LVSVRIYAEGGGEGELADTQFRNAWADFFKAAGLAGRMPRVIRGKGRQRAYDLFRTAVENRTNETVPLLLIDSEDAVRPDETAWDHLKRRDGWDPPPGAGADDAFLMVQVMETWFLADRSALQNYFGSKLNERLLAVWPNLESVPKATVLDALEKATANCKTKYTKGRVSFEILAAIDPAEVEKRCPHAAGLLNRLRTL
jgi:Domain of unknown function (DUF4276)